MDEYQRFNKEADRYRNKPVFETEIGISQLKSSIIKVNLHDDVREIATNFSIVNELKIDKKLALT